MPSSPGRSPWIRVFLATAAADVATTCALFWRGGHRDADLPLVWANIAVIGSCVLYVLYARADHASDSSAGADLRARGNERKLEEPPGRVVPYLIRSSTGGEAGAMTGDLLPSMLEEFPSESDLPPSVFPRPAARRGAPSDEPAHQPMIRQPYSERPAMGRASRS
jgi:hypothetical protein